MYMLTGSCSDRGRVSVVVDYYIQLYRKVRSAFRNTVFHIDGPPKRAIITARSCGIEGVVAGRLAVVLNVVERPSIEFQYAPFFRD